MELILKSASVDLPQSIENLEQLKGELIPKLEKYNNLVVTEDSIKAAKDDKAALNKLKKAIEERRISIKKQYLEPYNALEAQCKELVRLIDEPIIAIDKQIKAFDEIEKQEKFTALCEAFSELDPPEWVDIKDVLNPKWENKTQKLDGLKAEMKTSLDELTGNYEKINKLYENFPHKIAILEKFQSNKDFSETMVYAKTLEFKYQQEQEQRAREKAFATENAQKAQESASAENSVITPPTEQTAHSFESEQTAAEIPVKILKGKFSVECTRDQLIALRDFMKAQGIKFEIIK